MRLSSLIRAFKEPRWLGIAVLYKWGKFIPDKLYLHLLYRLHLGKKLNLKNPQTFNEKLQWLKLYNRRPEYTIMVDKYAVKEYVANKVGNEFIIPTLGVWDSFDDIDFEKLPDKFVLKCTHDSGGLVICRDKSQLDRVAAKKVIERSLRRDYYLIGREWPYKNVPRRIICEQYMEDESGYELKDYKFFCFNGKVKYLKIDFDRQSNHRANYYNPNFELQPFGEKNSLPNPDRLFERPSCLQKMIEKAEELSKDVPFLRVDFYNVNGQVYFGEHTFFPGNGTGVFCPSEWDEKLGSLIRLPHAGGGICL